MKETKEQIREKNRRRKAILKLRQLEVQKQIQEYVQETGIEHPVNMLGRHSLIKDGVRLTIYVNNNRYWLTQNKTTHRGTYKNLTLLLLKTFNEKPDQNND